MLLNLERLFNNQKIADQNQKIAETSKRQDDAKIWSLTLAKTELVLPMSNT